MLFETDDESFSAVSLHRANGAHIGLYHVCYFSCSLALFGRQGTAQKEVPPVRMACVGETAVVVDSKTGAGDGRALERAQRA